jgi:protease-4
MQMSNMEGFLRHLGIQTQTLSTGSLKDAGTPFRAMTKEEESYLFGLINDMQEEFVRVVADSRKFSLEEARQLADGRAFTGRQALSAKLIDHLGDQQDALLRLRALAAPEDGSELSSTLLEGPKKKTSIWNKLLSVLSALDRAVSPSSLRYGFYYL